MSGASNPDIYIQIFFGRYRNWGSIQWTHLIILGSIMTVMANLYIFLFNKRLGSYSADRKKMHHRTQVPITQRDLGRTMYHVLINEMVRVKYILDAKVVPESADGGDPGWGKEKNVENVHFNTSIAKSFLALEKSASSRRPGLKHRDARSIRDYVAALRKAFPSIPAQLADDYVDTYERAVFSSHQFTHAEYSRFQAVALNIVELIKS